MRAPADCQNISGSMDRQSTSPSLQPSAACRACQLLITNSRGHVSRHESVYPSDAPQSELLHDQSSIGIGIPSNFCGPSLVVLEGVEFAQVFPDVSTLGERELDTARIMVAALKRLASAVQGMLRPG